MIHRVDSCAAKASFLAESKEERRLSRVGIHKGLPKRGICVRIIPKEKREGRNFC